VFNVSGKSIVIAGAGGGIGRAISVHLAGQGARLTLCDIDCDRLDATLVRVGSKAAHTIVDIRSESDCCVVMDKACSCYDTVDVVINAAGVLPIEYADSMDTAIFQDSLENNVTGAFLFSRAAKSSMTSGGSIIHIASVSSLVANTGYAAYSTSKAALSQLIKVLAREWAEENVRVNAIGPALIETPLTKDYLSDSTFYSNAIKAIPLGRLAKVEDLFGIIQLLSSSSGSFITGQTLYVDGGRTLV